MNASSQLTCSKVCAESHSRCAFVHALRPLHAAVAQQQLREPLPAAHQIDSDLLARPRQIPSGLARRRRKPRPPSTRRPSADPTTDRCRDGRTCCDPPTGAASSTARSPDSRSPPPPPRDTGRTRSGPPRSSSAPAPATQPASRPPARPRPCRTADATARRSPRPTTPRRLSARGHPSPPMSSFQSRPDLLRMGSAGATLRPVKPPQNATEVRPSTPTRIIPGLRLTSRQRCRGFST